jgi:hypothetical protein
MRNRIFIFIAITFIVFFSFRYCEFKKQDSSSLTNDTNLIQQQILNVGKLIVTEGHFSEVLTYKDSEKYLGGMISFDKKALLVVNAEVTVGYDLHLLKYEIDSIAKTVTLVNIPPEEIKISPDIKFYDVEQSKLNPFTGDDYNKISVQAKVSIAKKIEKSTLKTNAQNRLISELSKMLILTNSMGWTLLHRGNVVNKETDIKL